MSRPKKRMADHIDDYLATCTLQECQDLMRQVRLLVNFRERQEAAKLAQEEPKTE